jgi:hypothetical protein
MLERKRQSKNYNLIPGDEADLELGEVEGPNSSGENGHERTVEEELDQWDENEDDWETTEPGEINNDSGKKISDTSSLSK